MRGSMLPASTSPAFLRFAMASCPYGSRGGWGSAGNPVHNRIAPHPESLAMIAPSPVKSPRRGDDLRQASPILREGSGSAKARSWTPSRLASVSRLIFRQQRHAEAVGHHLHARRQARGSGHCSRFCTCFKLQKLERLIAQAMALLQQKQPLILGRLRRGQRLAGKRPTGRHGQHKIIITKWS